MWIATQSETVVSGTRPVIKTNDTVDDLIWSDYKVGSAVMYFVGTDNDTIQTNLEIKTIFKSVQFLLDIW